MTINDYITGELITISDYMDAYREAKSRIRFHNSEFNYAHRGKHYCQNAEMVIEGDLIIIRRKIK